MRSLFFLCCLVVSWQVEAQPASQPLQKIICGDGVLDAGEQCDDGNNQDGDACAADCLMVLQPEAPTLPPATTQALQKNLYDAETLLNPAVDEGPYYRSPRVALWLSAAPTVASFAGLYTTLIYRGVTNEIAPAALTASLAGVSISPSLGMIYAQKPSLAFGLMALRGGAAGLFALGLALHRDDPEGGGDLDERIVGIGFSTFTLVALLEVISTVNAAKQSHPPGTPKPATIIKQ
jgi:cysteine-rich repeat protein